MMNGLMAPDIEVDIIAPVDEIDPEQNEANTKRVVEEWNFGPEEPSDKPGSNAEFWKDMAYVWNCEEEESRRKRCSNCQYFDSSPERLEAMESVEYNDMDEGAGGRGYCHKFDFICHNLRVCQGWKRKC